MPSWCRVAQQRRENDQDQEVEVENTSQNHLKVSRHKLYGDRRRFDILLFE